MDNNEYGVVVILTEMCNLQCKYCYVHDNTDVMSPEVMDKTLEHCERLIVENNKIVSFDVFGGEPLTKRDELKMLIEKAYVIYNKYKGKFRFKIYSNLTLLDQDYLDFFTKYEPMVTFNLSIDGNKQCHDSARVDKCGNGTYDIVIEKVEMLAKWMGVPSSNLGGQYVVSPSNIQYMYDSIVESVESGRKRVRMSLNRDNVWNDDNLALLDIELTRVREYYEKQLESGNPISIDIFTVSLIDMTYKSHRFCGAGHTIMAIAPNGDVYPCQRLFNSRSEFIYGNVLTGIKPMTMFDYMTVESHFKDCSKCDTFDNFNCLGQCIGATYDAFKDSHGKMGIFKCIPGTCKLLKLINKQALILKNNMSNNDLFLKTLKTDNFEGK